MQRVENEEVEEEEEDDGDLEIEQNVTGAVLKETFYLVIEVAVIAFVYKLMNWMFW